MPDELCHNCGADEKVWQEVFGEQHSCPKDDTVLTRKIVKTLNLFRQKGVPLLQVDGTTTREFDDVVQGYG